ncbi:PASTA domain-containing protein [Micromonospora sp. NPDC050397]|uniref:PASTA domain-containing protein n=1 Tax=Micromonospora sp. NPDC050397 TaxID=3364279 RepID=UPI00384D16D5
MIAGAVVATVLLATIGATGGWVLAREDSAEPVNGAGPTPTTTTSAPSPTKTPKGRPSNTTPSGGKTTGAPAGQFALPDFAGQSFQEVRQDLRDRGLGWQIIFGNNGEESSVVRTDPAAGADVRKGITVKVYVKGVAPLTDVPDVNGLSCSEAQARVVEAGFTPSYPNGKGGQMVRQEPRPGDRLRWNDKVVLFCGTNLPGGQPSPATT